MRGCVRALNARTPGSESNCLHAGLAPLLALGPVIQPFCGFIEAFRSSERERNAGCARATLLAASCFGVRREACGKAVAHTTSCLRFDASPPPSGLARWILGYTTVVHLCTRRGHYRGRVYSMLFDCCSCFVCKASITCRKVLDKFLARVFFSVSTSPLLMCVAYVVLSCVLFSRSVQTKNSKRLSASPTPSSLPRTCGSASTLILRRQVGHAPKRVRAHMSMVGTGRSADKL